MGDDRSDAGLNANLEGDLHDIVSFAIFAPGTIMPSTKASRLLLISGAPGTALPPAAFGLHA